MRKLDPEIGSLALMHTTINVVRVCAEGQAKFFSEKRLQLHNEIWPKPWLETNFQPIGKSFNHAARPPKVLKAVRIGSTWATSEAWPRG